MEDFNVLLYVCIIKPKLTGECWQLTSPPSYQHLSAYRRCSYLCAWITFCACFPVVRDHPAVIKRRFTSVLIVSGLSPLFVWAWRESAGVVVSRDLVPVPQDEHFVLRCITVSVFTCVSEWSVFAGSHGNPVWRPHSCRYTSSAPHHGKKQPMCFPNITTGLVIHVHR